MGKGTKHAADWKETTLQVVLDAKRLYTHSVKIMGNEKVFKPSNDFHCATLNKQYKGEFGYNPGSQMVQIAGIAYLNGLDHFHQGETAHKTLCALYGNSNRLLRRMDSFYRSLERSIQNG